MRLRYVQNLVVAAVALAAATSFAEKVRKFVLADESRPRLHYWDTSDPSKCFSIPGERPMWDLKKLGDMRYRAVCKKGFKVFDLRERKVVDEFRHPSLDEVTAVCDMPDGGFVASVNPQSGPDKNKVVLLQRFSAARELVATYRCEGFFYARSLQWDRDGKTLLLSWEKGFARIRLPKEGNVCEVIGDFRQPKGRNLFDVVPSIAGDGYVAGCGYRGGLVRFDKDGKVQSAWFVPEQDGCVSFFYAQPHEMPDGHVYMAHWTGHGANDSTKGWQVVEFDGEGRAVWHLHDPERLGSVSGIDVLPTAARTAGWDNINPDRKDLPPQKILWTADLAQAKLELRDGAEGSMRIVDADGGKALEIVKTNGKGTMVVKLPPFAVAKKARLRASVRCSSCDGDPEMGDGCVRLYGKKEDLTAFQMPDERRVGGPYLDKMVNSPPGGSIRKLAYRVADDKTGTNITAAIVVSGPPCTSRWSALVVEDNAAARKAWNAHKTALEPVDVTAGMISAEAFAAQLAADTDHTAKIAKIGDYTRLLIDGKEAAPVIFKGQTSKGDVITYAGGIHDKKGVHLQMVTVRFGRTEKNPLGIWTKDGFDAKAGAELVRTAMRLAPGSKFLLGLRLDAYPEWVDMHPGEEWLLEDGRKVYGHHVHASFKILPEKPKDKWYWPSYHSVAWREEVKARIAELVEELRRQGLLKRIVGVHLAGYHDAQFATRQPDFSKCAVAAFVEWQKKHLGEVKWTTAPKFGPEEQLDPVASAHQMAYLRFIKQGPFHVQEDIARHIRRLFGKDIVVGRYCMGWGAAAFNNALDLDPFLLSDSIDFLVAQPSYTHRLPGVAIGSRIPTRSFHDNGKLFVNEFDLRTYAGVHGGETEMMVLRCSQAQDFPMWQSIHHKVAGQMMSQRMGWWYLDMSGTWFSPPEIAQDIADVNALVPVAEREDTWHPSVAVATDEAGMLLRNSIAHYYGKGEGALQDQVRAFAASGVPHDSCMVDDFLRHPERAERYKAIVFVGMRHRDAGREALLKRLADKGVKCAFLTHENSITPTDFLRFVRDAGGYVPAEYGLEVDMNGSFISIHALRGGKFNFHLPRRCSVHNMKTGACEVKDAEILPLDLVAGETCWFRLSSSSSIASFDVDKAWQLEAPRRPVVEHAPGILWLEAENFDSYGGWLLDTQFAHKMGSGYLLAPGVGKPVRPAETAISVPSAGRRRVWVRCKDWIPEYHPGRFAVEVDGKRLGKTFGASGQREWIWEDGGEVDLDVGVHKVRLVDLSGYYARCDALVLASDLSWRPAADGKALAEQRAKMNGEPAEIAEGGMYDVVVVGGGPAGVPAALAAARGGAKVVLLQDRPVLGGNISSELGVLLNGAAGHPGYREGGIIEEAVLDKAHEAKGGELSFSRVFDRMVAAEPNLKTVLNARVESVEQDATGTITAVLARNLLTGERTRYRARLFVDATGDGWVGYFAGAHYMFGREGQATFGETCAPEKPDLTTMSGCLLGGYGVPRLDAVKTVDTYETPVWARVLPKGFTRNVTGLSFKWWLEHPGYLDDCRDPELARDELLRIFFAFWGWLKNDCPDSSIREQAAHKRLRSLPYMNGRREGMRLKGDVVYTEQDALTGRLFEDRIGHTGWPLDTHDPLGVQNPKGNGFWHKHPRLPKPASIPYRILYSENIPNLFMAGRNVSCSHVGLGTLRVAATCAVMGQAVGTAAAGCVRCGLTPREYGKQHIVELQRQLLKDDQFIPEMKYEDAANLASGGKATADSEHSGNVAANVLDGYARTLKGGPSHEWISDPAQGLPQAIRVDLARTEEIGEVRIVFDSNFYVQPKWVKHVMPTTLAKSYLLEGSADGKSWETLADVSENCRRLAVHCFARRRISSLRLTVRGTYGDASARVFEIRCYK